MLPWLAIACVLHTSYQFVLIRAYEANDFAVAYPVARGVAPITTAILGVALLGDSLTVASLLGIALVSGGILLVALGRSIAVAGLIAAGIAGLLTTAYIGRRWRCSCGDHPMRGALAARQLEKGKGGVRGRGPLGVKPMNRVSVTPGDSSCQTSKIHSASSDFRPPMRGKVY